MLLDREHHLEELKVEGKKDKANGMYARRFRSLSRNALSINIPRTRTSEFKPLLLEILRFNQESIENQLLMALEYIREYRTYFHVSQSYGISESSCYKGIKWIEDTLIKHPDFALSCRKALLKSEMEYEVVLIDGAEMPIERQKKKIPE